jgi:hypothetical protein
MKDVSNLHPFFTLMVCDDWTFPRYQWIKRNVLNQQSQLQPTQADMVKLAMLNNFRSFNTAQMTAPSASSKIMNHLENEPVNHLSAEFEQGLKAFWKQLQTLLMPNGHGVAKKSFNGQPLTG